VIPFTAGGGWPEHRVDDVEEIITLEVEKRESVARENEGKKKI
jgi:hypothetical protein